MAVAAESWLAALQWPTAGENAKPCVQTMRYQLGVRRYDFDSGLAPYPWHTHQQWSLLTSQIHESVLGRLLPASGFVDILAEARDLSLMAPTTDAERRLVTQLERGRAADAASPPHARPPAADADGAAPMSTGDAEADAAAPRDVHGAAAASTSAPTSAAPSAAPERCHYTAIPSRVRRAGRDAAELTSLNLDKSALLARLFEPDAVVGELQFAFVTFLVGQSLEGFLQWKALLGLLFSCDEAATRTHTHMYADFLRTLCAQLSIALRNESRESSDAASSQGLAEPLGSVGFEDSLQQLLDDSFLKRAMMEFLEVMVGERDALPPDLWYQSELLRKLVNDTLGWDLADADSEDGPIVVESFVEVA